MHEDRRRAPRGLAFEGQLQGNPVRILQLASESHNDCAFLKLAAKLFYLVHDFFAVASAAYKYYCAVCPIGLA